MDRLVDINVCKEKDFKDCWMFFSMKEMDGENVYEAQISKEQGWGFSARYLKLSIYE